jgi:hypothetical protein
MSFTFAKFEIERIEVVERTAHEIVEATTISFQNTGSHTCFINEYPLLPGGHKQYSTENSGVIDHVYRIRFGKINQYADMNPIQQECACNGPRLNIETITLKGFKTINT